MKRLAVVLILLAATTSFAAMKFNPLAGHPDFYEHGVDNIAACIQDNLVGLWDNTLKKFVCGPVSGTAGPQGPAGDNGVGVPVGGTTEQILSKIDNTDYNTHWVDKPTGGHDNATVLDSATIDFSITGQQITGSVITTGLDCVVAGGNRGVMTGADKTKLDGIAAGATVGADWTTNLSNIPSTFTPSTHNNSAHSETYITQDNNARVAVKKAGAIQGTRRGINLIEGSNVTLTVADDSGNEEVDVTIAATGAGGINNVVEDTTPELGGNLDGMGRAIDNVSSVSTQDPGDGKRKMNLRRNTSDPTGADLAAGDIWLLTSNLMKHRSDDNTATYTLWDNGNLPVCGTDNIWKSNGSAMVCAADGGSGSMVYPGAGIAVSTGSAWGTSLTAPSGAIVGTTDSQELSNKSFGTGMTWPTFNQNTTGTAAGLTAAYIDWNAGSGGASILNKPTLGTISTYNVGTLTDTKLCTYETASGFVCNTTASGTGDVVGPSSATDNALAQYDGTTGKLIKNSPWTIGSDNVLRGPATDNTQYVMVSNTGTPTSPAEGWCAYDSTNNGWGCYNGASWDTVFWQGGSHTTLADIGTNTHAQIDTHISTGAHVTGGDSHDHAGGDGAQIDHGGLAGLADDDHPQYQTVNYSGLPGSDHTSLGPKTNALQAGATITIMDLVILNSSGQWVQADANAASTYAGMLAISLEGQTSGNAMSVALPGTFVRDDTWNWTPGQVLYISETAGAITATAPTTTDSATRIVGYAVSADVIYFDPDGAWITHS